jgi:rubrerythrin
MPFSEKDKEEVLKKAGFRCCVCRSHPATHVHHIIPQKDGGPDTEDNAAPLCPNCHDTYGGNPEKRKFITRNRNDWYEICEKPAPADIEQIQGMFDKFGKNLATKEDIQKAVSYLDDQIQNIMRQPLSTSEQLVRIGDATAAFSIATTSASIRPTIAPNSSVIYHVCGDCGNAFDCNEEKCPSCGHPK